MTTEAQAKHPRGRNGNRRHTTAEAMQRGQHALAVHRRKFGETLVENTATIPPPPAWFSRELKEVFLATIASAPPGLLRAGDFENLVTLASAVVMHRQVAQEALNRDPDAGPKEREILERRLRMASAAVGRISKTLGLTPPERARIGLTAAKESDKGGEWTSMLTVVDGAKAA
jgi:hypothetical protein